MARTLLWIAVGGGAGSILRYLTALAFSVWVGGHFPWPTLLVNVVGALLIGFVDELVVHARVIPKEAVLAITTGFLGGLTTFSTFALESVRLSVTRELVWAGAYVAISLAAGVSAVVLGAAIAKSLVGS